MSFAANSEKVRLCLDLHEQWHRTRHDLEEKLGIAKPYEPGDRYFGNCNNHLYRPMELDLDE